MENQTTSTQRSCETCLHEEKDICEKPCYDCVDSKRWIKFDPSVNFTQWEPKKKENN